MFGKALEARGRYQLFGGILSLLFASVIWGFTYSAQREGAELMPPLVFLAARSWIGIVALLPWCALYDILNGRKPCVFGSAHTKKDIRNLLAGGCICGIFMFGGAVFQQWGLTYTSAGKAGFLTSLQIMFVPFCGLLFKRRTRTLELIAVAVVLCGAYLLCWKADMQIDSMNVGDFLLLICAFVYTWYVLFVDRFSKLADCVRLCFVQFLVTAILATAGSWIAGNVWDWNAIHTGTRALLCCGVASTGFAYIFEFIGQKYVQPVVATLLMSMQSVFAVLGGWIFLGETLTIRECLGCLVILIGVVLAQLPDPWKTRKS